MFPVEVCGFIIDWKRCHRDQWGKKIKLQLSFIALAAGLSMSIYGAEFFLWNLRLKYLFGIFGSVEWFFCLCSMARAQHFSGFLTKTNKTAFGGNPFVLPLKNHEAINSGLHHIFRHQMRIDSPCELLIHLMKSKERHRSEKKWKRMAEWERLNEAVLAVPPQRAIPSWGCRARQNVWLHDKTHIEKHRGHIGDWDGFTLLSLIRFVVVYCNSIDSSTYNELMHAK